jgi:hypothetical protein
VAMYSLQMSLAQVKAQGQSSHHWQHRSSTEQGGCAKTVPPAAKGQPCPSLPVCFNSLRVKTRIVSQYSVEGARLCLSHSLRLGLPERTSAV